MKKSNEKGITLIALVITIIVLLILAGVAISILTGDNGIINNALRAREETKHTAIEEQLRLAKLSTKIKLETEKTVEIKDYLKELEAAQVDYDITGQGEESVEITIEGKYVYELTKGTDGNIDYEDQGTVSKIKPKIEKIEITNKTSNLISVKVTTLRNEGGTLKYYIKEENAQEYTFVVQQAEEEYDFSINPEKRYIKIKVEAIAKNGEIASKEKEIENVPDLKEGMVSINYQKEWTEGPLTVTVSTPEKRYTLQTSQDGINWEDADSTNQTANQLFTQNGSVYARLVDKKTGQAGKFYEKKITNIDTQAPNAFTPKVDNTKITTNSITIKGSTTDPVEADGTAGSGIETYYFRKGIKEDNQVNWSNWEAEGQVAKEGEEASYTFNSLIQEKEYTLQMKAVDKVGRETISNPITTTTGKVPGGKSNISFSYSNTNWTNGKVDVTITDNTGSSAYKLQYSIDNGSTWTDYTNKVSMESYGSIIARLTDNTEPGKVGNIGAIATGNVVKIDKTKPIITNPLTVSSSGRDNITVKIKVKDEEAGLSKIKWYYKKETETEYTSQEDVYQTMNGATAGIKTEQEKTKTLSDLVAKTTYQIYVEVYDVAGNCTSTVDSPIISKLTAIVASDIANDSDKAKYYGATVNGYECTNNAAVGNWKLFYADANNIYLIADDCVTSEYVPKGRGGSSFTIGENTGNRGCAPISPSNDYSGSGDITNTKVQALNSQYFKYLTDNSTVSTLDNMKVVAYLLDTNIWNGYQGAKAEFAIGGPTLELLFKSYNEKYKVNYRTRVSNLNGYQYNVTSDEANWTVLHASTYMEQTDSLYKSKRHNDLWGYWLASPAENRQHSILTVRLNIQADVCSDGNGTAMLGYRPVVCLSSEVELEKTADGVYTLK